ncbi:MAG: hypothetical protein MJ070_08320 [Lachnospiraceae bacterium]|nr:hypothetical protein [Lachnospiraceae bacterium]
MKKLALFLALIMVVAACVIPVSAADEKTISFEAHAGDAAYLVSDKSTVVWPESGDQYYWLKNGEQLVYKFTLEGNASSAKITMPALGVYEIWAGSTIDGAKKVYTSAQLASFKDAYCGNGDNWSTPNLDPSEYTTVFEPLLEEVDLTSALDGTTLYVILKCTSDIPSDIKTGIWAKDSAVSNSTKYVNRRWNLSNNFPKDGGVEGSRSKSDKVAGEKYSDGLVTLTYTLAPAAPAGEKKVIKMLDFDEAYFGSFDTENHVDGTGCCSFTFKETSGTEVFQKKFDAIDLSECDFVEFWFYISDASKLDQFTGAQIELTSSGTCDKEEATWNIPASWDSIIVGEAKDGWNLIRLDIHKQGDNGAKWNNINWFRLYTLEGKKLAGVTIKFDDMYAYTEGAEVPAPQKAAPETPDDPTPATFDAVSSVAVVAVAAMGVVLVASKKRH